MATTLSAIRAGLASNLAVLSGVQVSAYMLDNPTPPTLEVFPDRVDWDITLRRGFDSWRMIVRGFVGSPTDQGAQILLDAWIDPSGSGSVKAALEATQQRTDAFVAVHVAECSGYRVYDLPNLGRTLGCEWVCDVAAAGS